MVLRPQPRARYKIWFSEAGVGVVVVGGGGGFGAVSAAPDDADEEGAQGREAGGYDGNGGFGTGPDGDGDVVPYWGVIVSLAAGETWGEWAGIDVQVMSGFLPFW